MLRASAVALLLTITPTLAQPPSPFWFKQMARENGTPDIHGPAPRSGTLGITDGLPYISWEEYTRLAASIGKNWQFDPEDVGDGPDEDGRYWTVKGHVFDPHWQAPDDQGFPHDGPCIQDYCFIIVEYTEEDGVMEPVGWNLEMGPMPYNYGEEPPAPPEDAYTDDEDDDSDLALPDDEEYEDDCLDDDC
jgi:hypothetical protein